MACRTPIVKICEWCDKSYTLYDIKTAARQKFCSRKCAVQGTIRTVPKIKCTCMQCGLEYGVNPSEMAPNQRGGRKNTFCSRICFQKFTSTTRTLKVVTCPICKKSRAMKTSTFKVLKTTVCKTCWCANKKLVKAMIKAGEFAELSSV